MLKTLVGRAGGFLILLSVSPAWAAPADELVAKIKGVGAEGAGNTEAAKAWKELVKVGPDAIVPILSAMDDNKRIASNWLRPAVDAIGEKAIRDKQPLPKDDLEKFVRKTTNPPAGRRIAYEWLTRIDPTAPGRLLPGMIQDPSAELRREAIAVVVDDAQKAMASGDNKAAVALLHKALTGACEKEQIEEIAKQLKTCGEEIDVAAHLGFIRGWHLVTPFDNPDEKGLQTAYPPEKGVDLKEAYKGKGGDEAKWTETRTADPFGVVDLNKVLGKKKATVAYAYAVIDSPGERAVQVRVGTMNAVKIFLNGKELFARDEYHHGMNLDYHIANGALKAGRNEILLKICQNDQKEDWAQDWMFQARLSDSVGSAVPFTLISTKPKEKSN
jgi:hypothetical protein